MQQPLWPVRDGYMEWLLQHDKARKTQITEMFDKQRPTPPARKLSVKVCPRLGAAGQSSSAGHEEVDDDRSDDTDGDDHCESSSGVSSEQHLQQLSSSSVEEGEVSIGERPQRPSPVNGPAGDCLAAVNEVPSMRKRSREQAPLNTLPKPTVLAADSGGAMKQLESEQTNSGDVGSNTLEITEQPFTSSWGDRVDPRSSRCMAGRLVMCLPQSTSGVEILAVSYPFLRWADRREKIFARAEWWANNMAEGFGCSRDGPSGLHSSRKEAAAVKANPTATRKGTKIISWHAQLGDVVHFVKNF